MSQGRGLSRIVITALLCCAISACSDKSTDPDGQIEQTFSGITVTDSSGTVISIDPDDWCLDSIPADSHPADTGSQSDSGIVDNTVPTYLSLGPAYPNPFESITACEFQIPTQTSVLITVLDGKGFTDTVVSATCEAGSHLFEWDATGLPKGLYRFEMSADDWSCHGDVQVE